MVELGDDGVSRVGDDGAEDTSDVTGGGSDSELLDLGALGFGAGHDVLVEHLDGALEGPELHHGVRHLATPERGETLVETTDTLGINDTGHSLAKSGGESALLGVRGLNTDLHGLPGAQGHVGDHLSRGGGREPQQILVGHGVLCASCLHEGVLEHLIQTKLEQSLQGVSNQGGSPSKSQSADSILCRNLSERRLDSDLHIQNKILSVSHLLPLSDPNSLPLTNHGLKID